VPSSKKPERKSPLPEVELEALARCFLPKLREYYEADEGRAAFEDWKARQPDRDSGDKE
jgi:hypothetical protein